MGIKSNLLIQATKYNNKKIVKFILGFFNVLDTLFSYVKKEESLNNKSNKHLNDALVCAIENLNCNIVELLVNAGADVNSLDKNNKNAIVHTVERLAISKDLTLDPSKNLPEEIISHPIVQFLLGKGSEYHETDDMNIERKYALPIKKNVRHSLQLELTYSEVDDFREDSNSLDSGYSSTEECKTQKKSIDSLQQGNNEPIDAKVDLVAKREARRNKQEIQSPIDKKQYIKKLTPLEKLTKHAAAGIYLKDDLVEEKVNKYEQLMKRDSDKVVNRQGKLGPKVNSHVGQMKQKYESSPSGYESDIKMERLRIKHNLPKM